MMTQNPENEIDALLPWHAAGKLSRRDAERVEAALADNEELARRYALVREELAETVRLNQMLGAPSPRALERLMARIDAEPAPRQGRRLWANFGEWLAQRLVALGPRAVAWSLVAAVLVILVQAGLLARLFLEPGGSYRTASVEQAGATAGTYALVAFVPEASAAEVTRFLDRYQAAIVDGPRAGGLYRIRIGAAAKSKDELANLIRRMQQESGVVRFAAPAE
jgi:anti-sigma factor RsiW